MIADVRITVWDAFMGTCLCLDANTSGDIAGSELIQYEDTPSGNGAGRIPVGLSFTDVVGRGYWRGYNIVEISTGDSLMTRASLSGATKIYVDSNAPFDTSLGEDTQQAYFWDGSSLTMLVPVTSVGHDANGDFINIGSPVATNGNPSVIPAYGIGTIVGRRRYCGRIIRRERPNVKNPLTIVSTIGLGLTGGMFDHAVGTYSFVNEDSGTAIYQAMVQFATRVGWSGVLNIQAGNFPTIGTNFNGNVSNSQLSQLINQILTAISTGDKWIVRVGHDRTPRLLKVYDSASNTYTYNLTLPQGVYDFEPLNVKVVDEDASNLFNSIEVIGDTDPITNQPVNAIVQDATSISTLYGQVDGTPVTVTGLKSVGDCESYASALLNEDSLAVSNNSFRIYTRNDNSFATNLTSGVNIGDTTIPLTTTSSGVYSIGVGTPLFIAGYKGVAGEMTPLVTAVTPTSVTIAAPGLAAHHTNGAPVTASVLSSPVTSASGFSQTNGDFIKGVHNVIVTRFNDTGSVQNMVPDSELVYATTNIDSLWTMFPGQMTTLTANSNVGDTSFTVASTAGMKVGMTLQFQNSGPHVEQIVVATVTDATHFTIAAPGALYAHTSTNGVFLWFNNVASGSSQALKLSAGSSNISNIDCYSNGDLIDIVPGYTYTFSGYIDATGFNNTGISSPKCGWRIVSADGTTLIADLEQTPGSVGRLSGTFVAPAGVAQCYARCRIAGNVLASNSVLFTQPMLTVGQAASTTYAPNFGAPKIFGLCASVVSSIDLHGDRYQDVKFAAVEPDWNAAMAERAQGLANALRQNTSTPLAIDQYCVSVDAYPYKYVNKLSTVVSTVNVGDNFVFVADATKFSAGQNITVETEPLTVKAVNTGTGKVTTYTNALSSHAINAKIYDENKRLNISWAFASSTITVSPPAFLALFSPGSNIVTVTGAQFVVQPNATNWAWLQNDQTFLVKQDPSGVPGAILYGIFTTSTNAVIGQTAKAPIGVFKIGLGNINVASNLPAPTVTNNGGLANVASSHPTQADIQATVAVSNVPQSGLQANDAHSMYWALREHGTATWTVYGESDLQGLPSPPASQTNAFVYAQLANGKLYDFAVGYVGIAGYGPPTQIGTSPQISNGFAARSIVVTGPYLDNGALVVPAASQIATSLTSGTSVGATNFPVADTSNLVVGESATIGSGGGSEALPVSVVHATSFDTSTAAANTHSNGAAVTLPYAFNGISANGVSAEVTISFTLTNQPVDGTLSRVHVWYRLSSGTSKRWADAGALDAVGLGTANTLLTTLSVGSNIGDTSFTVVSSAGLSPGQYIGIGGGESFQIATVPNGTHFTTTAAAVNNHGVGATVFTAPSPIGNYVFGIADLTNGASYDFAVSMQSTAGRESSKTTLISNFAAQALDLPAASLPTMPTGTTISATGSVLSYSGVSGGACQAQISVTPVITPPGSDPRPFSNWGTAFRILRKINNSHTFLTQSTGANPFTFHVNDTSIFTSPSPGLSPAIAIRSADGASSDYLYLQSIDSANKTITTTLQASNAYAVGATIWCSDLDTTAHHYSTADDIPAAGWTGGALLGLAELAAGHAYQLAVMPLDGAHIQNPPVAVFAMTLPQKIGSGSIVDGPNILADSSFLFVRHASDPGHSNATINGFDANGHAGGAVYWTTCNVDGINTYFSRVESTPSGANCFVVYTQASNPVDYQIRSEAVILKAGVTYSLSGYVDATACSIGNPDANHTPAGNPGWYLVPFAWDPKHPDEGIVLASAAQDFGSAGVVQAQYTPLSDTKCYAVFQSRQCKISASISPNKLIVSTPMLQVGTSAGPYTPGPYDKQPKPDVPASANWDTPDDTQNGVPDGTGGGYISHAALSWEIQNTIEQGTRNFLNVEFVGAKHQPDGSLTNVVNAQTSQTFTFVSGQPITISAQIARNG